MCEDIRSSTVLISGMRFVDLKRLPRPNLGQWAAFSGLASLYHIVFRFSGSGHCLVLSYRLAFGYISCLFIMYHYCRLAPCNGFPYILILHTTGHLQKE
ncbi:hypothetical protein BDZ97DRAFT_1789242 [Flammula alnicola]|nr:hypothetical protein BDZ97DRAFT_1789242 [Flammula alnicola]